MRGIGGSDLTVEQGSIDRLCVNECWVVIYRRLCYCGYQREGGSSQHRGLNSASDVSTR
jgi:hypothetical protein